MFKRLTDDNLLVEINIATTAPGSMALWYRLILILPILVKVSLSQAGVSCLCVVLLRWGVFFATSVQFCLRTPNQMPPK